MSMLAERKRKQKWSLNPRGKTWSSDANKFGQKMLEKMGWQQGKGLGANENGITENIKVSYKNDSQGMGYKESSEQWTEHENNFSALLESLSGELKNSDDIKVNSLEEKSQTSRARVHYHKFTRGKDLSRYSEKDLANIFGKRHLKETKSSSQVGNEQEEEKSDTNGTSFLFNGGSMKDYFKKKIPNYGCTNGYVIGNNGVLKKDDSESDSEFRPGFGFGIKSEETKNEDQLVNIKSKSTFVSYVPGESIKRRAEYLENNIFSPKKKVKKDKIKENEVQGHLNPAFNPMSTPIKVTKHVLETIEENEFLESSENNTNQFDNDIIICYGNKKKEKKKIKNMDIESIMAANDVKNLTIKDKNETSDYSQVCNQNFMENQVKNKKKNKVKDVDIGISNPVFQSNVENEIAIHNNNTLEIKSKKKKKNKQSLNEVNDGGISNPIFNDNAIDKTNISQENPYEVNIQKNQNNEYIEESNVGYINSQIKKKKLKKKAGKEDQAGSLGLSNPVFEDNIRNVLESFETINESFQTSYEVKVKRKKDKKVDQADSSGLSNPVFEDNIGNNTLESFEIINEEFQTSYEVKVKRKKNKKPKHNTDFLTENSNFTGYESFNLALEGEANPYEVKRKGKKHKKDSMGTEDSNIDVSQDLVDNTNVSNSEKLSNEHDLIEVDSCDLMLNVVSEPVVPKSVKMEQAKTVGKIQNLTRRKSVRFSNVTQELIIPNNDEIKMMENESESGIDNMNFDSIRTHVDENLETISKQLDMYQAEIENDINEQKQINLEDIMIGEVGNPQGENEKLSDGTRLKLKYANFDSRTPFYQMNKTGAKKSYKHLIKGDIVVKFKNTNLHEIKGYAVVNRKKHT